MNNLQQEKLLVKIVIGAAWVDRHLEAEEIEYFQQLLEQYHLHIDDELQQLLKFTVPLKQTELWIVRYLKNSTNTERDALLKAIVNMLMADLCVSEIERELLDEYSEYMLAIPPHTEVKPTKIETVIRFIQKLIVSG
ncbi:MAG: TerB family tellurite resistance protein [Prochloraceae cyanobacterium]|nr:TerB family tellurite resistance protein [Prochloraceae cyanobacterium]